MSTSPFRQTACGNSSCGCGTPSRRDFLKATSLGAAGLLSGSLPAMAGPFARADFDKLVPADKKLTPQWVASLFGRGTPTVYRGEELRYIGMPVGGICAGQVYLGGDGRLWHWDIFNQIKATGADHYAHPPQAASPLKQGFSLQFSDGQSRPLDSEGFRNIAFRGEYPIGTVEYRDEACPLAVTLEAFSPFIPLNADDSSLPATIAHFTLHNTSAAPVEAVLVGTLENAVCLDHRDAGGSRVNRRVGGAGYTLLECSVEPPSGPPPRVRPDIVFEDWSKASYEGWTVEGTAFGRGPGPKLGLLANPGDGGQEQRVVNSHTSAPGASVGARDAATGKLTSRPFTIQRNFVRLWVGGGKYKGKTCVNLVVGGKVVGSVTGANSSMLQPRAIDARKFQGKQAVLEIVDAQKGGWGHIVVGRIVFSDHAGPPVPFELLPDNSSMCLGLLGVPAEQAANASQSVPMAEALVGELGRAVKLAPGESSEVSFFITWHFPNLSLLTFSGIVGRRYAERFASAVAVAEYVAANYDRLARQTRLWRDTWYDSSLPYWFLDRTFLNTSILASSTCYQFADGRFYGWEGVGCCPGTCTHVWHYAQAVARIFPELERDLRQRVDFGLALREDGSIRFRGEANDGPAGDGQAGSILRAYREHQMSADDAFLRHNWSGIKKALQYLIREDGDADGILSGSQHNTLDANWFGPVAWLSGLYLAALRAGEEMAHEVGDDAFARQCRDIFQRGRKNIVAQLFDGEYFVNKPDPQHPEAINSGSGCEIDQVLGQCWAFQVGLGRVLPEKETRSALQALWRYNFTPDVGPYRAQNKPGRWYAMPGEAGLLMCTFPRSDWDYAKAAGSGVAPFAGYFNECMNGFEHQVAGHMLWEGMLQEGLAVERAIHDRYHAARRNPWNEVECGDHYARSMASYGVYLAACGYEYHGPKEHLAFAPRLTPNNFRAAFTAAQGWGTFRKQASAERQRAEIELKWGRLRLKTLGLALAQGVQPRSVTVTITGRAIPSQYALSDGRLTIALGEAAQLESGQKLSVEITLQA